jgi:low affinity Fe/Cu permease
MLTFIIAAGMQVLAGLPRKAPALSSAALGAISQIASAHAIIAVTLTGVVALQGAQYYSERQLQKEISKALKRIETAQQTSVSKPAVSSSATKGASQTPKKRK